MRTRGRGGCVAAPTSVAQSLASRRCSAAAARPPLRLPRPRSQSQPPPSLRRRRSRRAQATTQSIDPPVTDPAPLPAPLAEPPTSQPQDSAPGQEKKSDQSGANPGKGKGNDGK